MRYTTKIAWCLVPVASLVMLAFALALPAHAEPAAPGADSDGMLLSEQRGGDRELRSRRHAGHLFSPRRDHRFISIQVGTRSMGGDDFDGTTFYAGEDEIFLVPNLDDATFYGVYFDFRNGYWGGGIGYSRASHDWSFAGIPADPADATSHFVDFDFRAHALPRQPIQPFLLLGFSLNGIRVEDGKARAGSDSLENLSMWGLGLNYGAGVDYYIGHRVKLTGGARWHVNGYNSISGQDLDEGLTCHGVNYYLSVGLGLDR